MEREISDRVSLWDTLNPYEDARRPTAIDRTVSNYNHAKENVQKIRDLIKTGRYDKDLAKYMPGLLELAFQGMFEDIDTKEKTAHPSYSDMEQLDFYILLTSNYYVHPNGMHICFPIKIKKGTTTLSNIDVNLIPVNNFFAHWVKEISITKYGSDKELPPTFSPYEVYQYIDSMLKHLPKDTLKTIQKTHLYSNEPIYYNSPDIDCKNHNGYGLSTTGLTTAQIATNKANYTKDLNIDDRITKFKTQIQNEFILAILAKYTFQKKLITESNSF